MLNQKSEELCCSEVRVDHPERPQEAAVEKPGVEQDFEAQNRRRENRHIACVCVGGGGLTKARHGPHLG